MSDEPEFLVWSAQHDAWWGPGRCGYVKSPSKAGKYSRAQALEICANSIPDGIREGRLAEIPVRVEDVRAMLDDGPWAGYAALFRP